eukprot:m.10991 g.10991  ORF g.10991 m.10991 type:complete len:304 (-) comp6789_c0_seq2:653-1564(-)
MVSPKILLAAITLVALVALSINAQEASFSFPCRYYGVNSVDSCQEVCTSFYQASSSSYSNGKCDCMTFGQTATACDDSSNFLELFYQSIGVAYPSCEGFFRSVYTEEVLTCAFSAALNPNGTFGNIISPSAGFDQSVCMNRCVNVLFGTINRIQTSQGMMCLNVLSGDDDFGDDDGGFIDVMDFDDSRAMLNLYCTEGGDGYCGDLAEPLLIFNATGSATLDACNTAAELGKCLGNFRAHLMELGESPAVVDEFVTMCQNDNGVDLTAASSGTEAPADISSGSLVAGSFVAIVVAAFVTLFMG